MADRTPRLILTLPDRQFNGLREVSAQTDLSMAEVLRRMIDYCSRSVILDELVPCMSGQIGVRGN